MKIRKFALFLAILVFLGGLASVTFPIWHGFILERFLQEQTQSFLSLVAPTEGVAQETEAEGDPLLLAMQEYNQRIYEENQAGFNGADAYEAPSFVLADYGYESEIFAVLSIPKLNLEMPVYLGASTENLAEGAAHLSETSLPIGGENTNAVIAGHRGWKGAAYFKYIPDLKPGDEVQITNLWETLTYQVVEIKDIYSSNTEALLIQPGRDLLTLMTCDYGTDGLKLRCLVICERAD